MKHNTGAGGVVVNKLGQILLVTNNGKFWGFPKGRIKKQESLLETAKREVLEEAGIKNAKYVHNLGSYQRFQISPNGKENPNIKKTIHMFVFTTEQIKLSPQVDDIGEARWVPKDEVVELLHHQKDKKFFQSIKDKL